MIAILIIIVAIYIFLYWQNYGLVTTHYKYENSKIPKEFKGFKIVQISDFHNTIKLHKQVVEKTKIEKPDIIAITGDLFDCRKTDLNEGFNLLKELQNISDIYFVTGNHEARIDNIDIIKDKIRSMGVNVLENTSIKIYKDNEFINIMGVDDPKFYYEKDGDNKLKLEFRNKLLKFGESVDGFKILLSHRPEFIHTYRDSSIDLALTGHAHGGQFRIPFTNIGVFVPDQGLFPPYAQGIKKLDNTTEIISRGLGNSVFPFRLFNRPEIVVVEFE